MIYEIIQVSLSIVSSAIMFALGVKHERLRTETILNQIYINPIIKDIIELMDRDSNWEYTHRSKKTVEIWSHPSGIRFTLDKNSLIHNSSQWGGIIDPALYCFNEEEYSLLWNAIKKYSRNKLLDNYVEWANKL